MISDLRYVDPVSLAGEMQTRSILQNIGTPGSVIDWVLDLVKDERAKSKTLERELALVHMDMNE